MRKVTAILLILYLLLVSACESNGQDVPQKGGMEQLGNILGELGTIKDMLVDTFSESRDDLASQFQAFRKVVLMDSAKALDALTGDALFSEVFEIINEARALAETGISLINGATTLISQEIKIRVMVAKSDFDRLADEILELARNGKQFVEQLNALFLQLDIIVDPDTQIAETTIP